MIRVAVNDRLWFHGEKRGYTVQAVSDDGRYAACTKPFPVRDTVVYTVIDFEQQLRGVDNSVGNSLGYETREDCEESLALFVTGEYGFSRRQRPITLALRGWKRGPDA